MKLKSHETSGKGTQKGVIPTADPFSIGDISFIFETFKDNKDSIELRISRGKIKEKRITVFRIGPKINISSNDPDFLNSLESLKEEK
jgi:hypothetical protein